MTKFHELMSQLKVGAVYWVDDENAEVSELSLEKLSNGFIDALLDAPEPDAKAAMSIFLADKTLRVRANNVLEILKTQGEDESSKADRIAPILEELVENIDNAAMALVDALKKLPGPLGEAERNALRNLFSSAEANWKWHTLSFTKWAAEGKQAFSQQTDGESILLVVDLQNASEVTPANGQTVLSDIARAGIDRKACHLVVLTSECKVTEEFKKGRQLTDQFFTAKPPRNPVFALSKNRFSKSGDALSDHMDAAFVNALERANLSLIQLEFAEQVRKHFQNSIQVAFNALETVTIEELAFAVMHTSQDEGASETETLVRIMNIAQREEFQLALATSAEIRSTILKLRGASAILPIGKSDLESDSELLKLRCAELYDKPEVVNKLYSPLSPGDLFAVQTEVHKVDENGRHTGEMEVAEGLYVLAANACDLMLRKDGIRRLETGMLLHVDEPAQQGEKQFKFELRHLEFTGVGGSSTKQIELREYKSVPLSLLDLCWTNPEGECTWLRTQTPLDDNLRESQKKRMNMLNAEHAKMTAADFASMARPMKIRVTSEETAESNVSSVRFEVRRVGRLSDRHAAQLVSRFSGVFGRPSEEHDFSGSRQAA